MLNLNNINKIAVIGAAGSSGLAALNGLQCLANCTIKGFEKKSYLGGTLWTTEKDSYAWRSLTTNVSKFSCAYANFPHQESTAIFPAVNEMNAYLKNYAQQCDVQKYISYNTVVKQVDFIENQWEVTSSTAENFCIKEKFDALVLANGMFSAPHMPKCNNADAFTGPILHSSDYKLKSNFSNKKVVIIGDGVSAAEIAVDLAGCAASITQLVRTTKPAFKIPKWLTDKNGKLIPWDLLFYKRSREASLQSLEEKNQNTNRFLTKLTGQNSIPTLYINPDSTESHRVVIVPPNYMKLMGDQVITIRHGALASFQENALTLIDGERLDADAVIFSTGYRPELEFFSPDLLEKLQSTVDASVQPLLLYESFMHAQLPLFGIGLGAFIGPYPAIAELQVEAMLAILSGKVLYPNEKQLAAYFEKLSSIKASDEQKQFINNDYPALADTYASLAGILPPTAALTQFVGLPFGPYQYRVNQSNDVNISGAIIAMKRLKDYMQPGSRLT